MQIRYECHGAAREVTGSKHLLRTPNATLLLDCGSFQGKRSEAEQKNRKSASLGRETDVAILSHGHLDHCGMLPLLTHDGFRGPIFSTAATRDIASIIMMDSAKIQAHDAEFLAKQARKRNEPFSWKPLYDEGDVTRTVGQCISASYDRTLPVADGITVTFRDAGHILGSSTVELTIGRKHPTTVLFSGDLGRRNKPILRDPAPLPDADYLILESTYGDRVHEASSDVEGRLAEIVGDAVKRNGKIVIPAFAVERTQDIIYYLHALRETNRIPKIPVFVDSPMALHATGVFKLHPECYDRDTFETFVKKHLDPFSFDGLTYIDSVEESKALNDQDGPCIIISASGMCESGRVQHHLIHTLIDPKNIFLAVGYMAADTVGRRILDGKKDVRILDAWVPVRARVEEIRALSGHADRNEILEYVSRMNLKRLKQVVLVHGEGRAQESLKKSLEELGIADVSIAEYATPYDWS